MNKKSDKNIKLSDGRNLKIILLDNNIKLQTTVLQDEIPFTSQTESETIIGPVYVKGGLIESIIDEITSESVEKALNSLDIDRNENLINVILSFKDEK